MNEGIPSRAMSNQVLTITLNEPDRRNPLSPAVRATLVSYLSEAAHDPDVRCIQITGTGTAFCSGGDTRLMNDRTSNDTFRYLLEVRSSVEAIVATPKPVVAAVNGPAVGAGFSLALACDLIVAAESARFAQLFAQIGLVPDSGASFFLVQRLGPYRAKELTLTDRMLTAVEAQQWGIVNKVWPNDVFRAKSDEFCAEIAAGPTMAFALAKHVINSAMGSDLATVMEMEALAQAVASGTSDHREALRARRERRGPTFSGQ